MPPPLRLYPTVPSARPSAGATQHWRLLCPESQGIVVPVGNDAQHPSKNLLLRDDRVGVGVTRRSAGADRLLGCTEDGVGNSGEERIVSREIPAVVLVVLHGQPSHAPKGKVLEVQS